MNLLFFILITISLTLLWDVKSRSHKIPSSFFFQIKSKHAFLALKDQDHFALSLNSEILLHLFENRMLSIFILFTSIHYIVGILHFIQICRDGLTLQLLALVILIVPKHFLPSFRSLSINIIQYNLRCFRSVMNLYSEDSLCYLFWNCLMKS